MKKKYILLSIIEGLTLDENTSFNLLDWTITNNKEFIIRNIPSIENIKNTHGLVCVEQILTKTLAFKPYESEDNPNYIMHNESSILNGLLSTIWVQFDNAIGTYKQYIQTIDGVNTFSNYRNSFVTDSKGSYSLFHLKNDLINTINNDILLQYEYLFHLVDREKFNEPSTAFRAELENDFIKMNRIQRSFFLLNIARSNSFLPMKIAFYINVLECLLLDNDAELSLRLQLFSASIIGKSREDKIFIRDIVNKSYNVRSKFFHGSVISLSKDELQILSSQIDEIIRKILIKSKTIEEIINTKNNTIRADYFKSIIFS